MDIFTKEVIKVDEVSFVDFFDMDSERYNEPGYVESYSIQNLRKIEEIQQTQLKKFAERMNGKYIPPSDEEIEDKINRTLEANRFVFPSISKANRIWALHENSVYTNMKNCAEFNNSGEHGIIIFPDIPKSLEDQPKVRLYRGATIGLGQQQVAPLARLDGVDVQDLFDYREGKTTLDQILQKVTDSEEKSYLTYILNGIRKTMAENNTLELDELRKLHTCFTPGALDWDLWVSTSFKPKDTYRSGNSVGNVYGDFFDLHEGYFECVMVLDVPESEVVKYHEEAGIFAQIKSEWIRAIVPQHTSALDKNIKKAEEFIK